MSDDGKMAAYVVARKTFFEADAAADDLAKRIDAAAKGIGKSASKTASYEAARNFSPNNPNEWIGNIPSPEETRTIMSAWAVARHELRAAFTALPEDARPHMQPLPKGV